MIKLLVVSTIKMSESDLRLYASRIPERAKDIKPEKFVEDLKNGRRICIEYPDGTVTAYEIMADN
jgi:hypothetical protein